MLIKCLTHCCSYLYPETWNWRADLLHLDDRTVVVTVWTIPLSYVPHGPIRVPPNLRHLGYLEPIKNNVHFKRTKKLLQIKTHLNVSLTDLTVWSNGWLYFVIICLRLRNTRSFMTRVKTELWQHLGLCGEADRSFQLDQYFWGCSRGRFHKQLS